MDISVAVIGISGGLSRLRARPLWRVAKLRRMVARTLAFPVVELILLDGETELKDHNTVGERRQMTSNKAWCAAKHLEAGDGRGALHSDCSTVATQLPASPSFACITVADGSRRNQLRCGVCKTLRPCDVPGLKGLDCVLPAVPRKPSSEISEARTFQH